MVTTGNSFALGAFETAVQGDAELLGVLYTGSLGRGTADRYSDLDIELWVADSACADPLHVARRVMGYLGPIQFVHDRGEGLAFITGFVGPDWQKVDLGLHHHSESVRAASYATARIVKDVDGSLARMLAQVHQETIAASWEQARAGIGGAIGSLLYLSLHNARGAVWSAMGEISSCGAEVYTLLALLRGRESFGFRYVEQLLSPTEQEMLRTAWPREADREEVRRAARALWGWTRHVWREAENTLGRSLEIRIDEAGLLAAVERIYSTPAESNSAPHGYPD